MLGIDPVKRADGSKRFPHCLVSDIGDCWIGLVPRQIALLGDAAERSSRRSNADAYASPAL